MVAGLTIQGGVSGAVLEVETTSKAARVLLYAPDGAPLIMQDGATVSAGAAYGGPPILGVDYKNARTVRASPSGTLRTTDESLFLYDSMEGAAYDSNKWVQTLATMTLVQAAGAQTLNNSAITTVTTGALHVSHRRFPFVSRGALVFRARVRATTHFNGNLHELGFGLPASATAAIAGDAAFWQKDSSGQWVPTIIVNGALAVGTAISDTTFVAAIAANKFFNVEVFLEATRARFTISLSSGEIAFTQFVEFPDSGAGFASTHLPAFYRTYNAVAPATAVQLVVSDVVVLATDAGASARPWASAMAGMGYSAATSPTAYTQFANYVNNTVAGLGALSNTAAGYATLGGLFRFAAPAGSETDYALFAIAIPVPYTFYATDVAISSFNTVAAVATTPTVFQWSLGFNSSVVSLVGAAPYTPMRVTIDTQTYPVGAAVGYQPPSIVQTFPSSYAVQPGRFIHVILRVPQGTATATEEFRGSVRIGGYPE